MPHLVVISTSGGGADVGTCEMPDIGAFAQRIYNTIEPLMNFDNPANCYPFMWYVGAVGEIFQEIDSIVRSDLPPWAVILDIDRCPDAGLPWLAQFVGVQFPNYMTPVQQRLYIKTVPNWLRGTKAAIVAATQIHLTGDQHVFLEERADGDPYKLRVFTLTTETPNSAQTLVDVISQKPAGIVLDYQVIAGQTYQQLFEDHPDYQNVFDVYVTYEGVFKDLPGT